MYPIGRKGTDEAQLHAPTGKAQRNGLAATA